MVKYYPRLDYLIRRLPLFNNTLMVKPNPRYGKMIRG